jgi:hypothetical protein
MPWLSLDNATTLLHHDLNKARKALERGISKSWLMRQSGGPQPATDPNVPLRIRVMPSPGWRLEGRAWLESPVLHWEESQIECSGKPWAPSTQNLSATINTQIRAKIEVWEEDIFRLGPYWRKLFHQPAGLIAALHVDYPSYGSCSCSVRRASRLRGCRPSRNCQKTNKEMRTSMRACAQELGALRGQRPGERCPLMALSGPH